MNLDMKDHITLAISKGVRMDGRKPEEFRKITSFTVIAVFLF